MSDMMRPPTPPMGGGMGGPPPGGGMRPPGGGMGKTSMLNPMDVAGKAATGGISKGMTVGQFLQSSFGISPDDPMEKFIQVMKQQSQNSTTAGKLGVQKPPMGGSPPMGGMGARPPMGGGMGGGRPSMPPSGGQGGPPSLEGLMNKL